MSVQQVPKLTKFLDELVAILATKKNGCFGCFGLRAVSGFKFWTLVINIFHFEAELLKNGMSSAGILESWWIHSDANAALILSSALCYVCLSLCQQSFAPELDHTHTHTTREHGDVVVSWLLLKIKPQLWKLSKCDGIKDERRSEKC